MSEFDEAIKTVLKNEGGYIDHPKDPGGATNYGISARFLHRIGDSRHPREITRTDAVELYKVHFWERYGYGQLEPQSLATKVFDMAVNTGPGQAHRIFQRALRANGCHWVDDDGALGPISFHAAEKASEVPLITSIRSEQAGFYRLLAAVEPEKQVFLNGWLKRAYEEV
jgi:lysozyme family protein